jgi:hypothetical protein
MSARWGCNLRSSPMISGDLAFYIALGFAAQLVDGALGMPTA